MNQPRTMPLIGLVDHEKIAIIASNFGRTNNPGWYYNLKAHPECEVHLEGRSGKYIARETIRDEYERYWQLAISYYAADRTIVAVKVRFSPPDGLPQDIWVDGVTYTDGVFHGNMGDDIPSLRLKFGQKIAIDEKDIIDWMIVEDGKLIGGYTIRLAMQRMSPDECERFLKTLDYSIED